jgi:hypothetical protein
LCLKNNSFYLHHISATLNILFMSKYVSSVVVTLIPKKEYSVEPFVSKVLELDFVVGSTIPHAIHFVIKSPLIKPYLSKYDIINLTFKYSEL